MSRDETAGQFISNRVVVTVAGSPLATIGGAALIESVAGMFLVSRSGETAFTAIDAAAAINPAR